MSVQVCLGRLLRKEIFIMEEAREVVLERELQSAKHLLASRAGQIRELRERVAGEEEITRLLTGFLALLALAAAGEESAGEAVCASFEEGTYRLQIAKSAIGGILDSFLLRCADGEDAFEVSFLPKGEGR
jgi:hypothetical protein